MEYIHGGDIYRHLVEYDFSVNVNPLGMPEKSRIAAQEGVMLATRYPDARSERLCTAVAEAEGVEDKQVLPGNGAAELIYALCYAIRPKKGLILAPSFQEYEAAVNASGGTACFWKLAEKDNFKLKEEILGRICEGTDILFLCNPNNPTGSLIDQKLLLQLAVKCERTDTYLCLDECFLPFLENEAELTMKKRLNEFKHLIILRAFTKIYGMPGLRLGYVLSSNEKLMERMRACLPPWNTSVPAQRAGIEALKDRAYLTRTRLLLRAEREYLLEELAGGLADIIYPPAANYIFFKARRDLQELLLKHKILIRSCANYRNLTEGYFRIGIRTHEENEALINRWKKG